MKNRLVLKNLIPDAFKALQHLDDIVQTGINSQYLQLIKIRASQLNGCSYCLNKHITDAVYEGESQQRINVLSSWKASKNWFTLEEQLILLLVEAITHIGNGGVNDELYERSVEVFGEERLAHIMMAAISINAWNRIGRCTRIHPIKY